MHEKQLITNTQLVPLRDSNAHSDPRPVDIAISGGKIVHIGRGITAQPGTEVIDGSHTWAMPGFWDEHVHLAQWAANRERLPLFGVTDPAQVLQVVAQKARELDQLGKPTAVIQGTGFRLGDWQRQPTVAELDAVSGAHPVILISMDCHCGWCNSSALKLLGLPAISGPISEADWFAVLPKVEQAPVGGTSAIELLREGTKECARLGVVGVVDVGFSGPWKQWGKLIGAGVRNLRVEAATYPAELEEVIAAGLRSNDPLPGAAGLAVMGPLKVITDGSLGTLTACCFNPYGPGGQPLSCGVTNYELEALIPMMTRANAHGLECAIHAIGDQAIATALAAFKASGARGAIEHVQQPRPEDIGLLAASGIRMSMQPGHLLDDRDLTASVWADRADQCFPLKSLAQAGADLRFGSDAPVSPIDPWRAISAAVMRSDDERGPWNTSQCLDVQTALEASVHGRGTLKAGDDADLILLPQNPLQYEDLNAFIRAGIDGKEWFAQMEANLTMVGGTVTYRGSRE